MADGADDEGHLGGGIDQSAGRPAPALDNSCPAENPSQLRKIRRQTAGIRQAKYPPKTKVKTSSLPSHVYNEFACIEYGLKVEMLMKRIFTGDHILDAANKHSLLCGQCLVRS